MLSERVTNLRLSGCCAEWWISEQVVKGSDRPALSLADNTVSGALDSHVQMMTRAVQMALCANDGMVIESIEINQAR